MLRNLSIILLNYRSSTNLLHCVINSLCPTEPLVIAMCRERGVVQRRVKPMLRNWSDLGPRAKKRVTYSTSDSLAAITLDYKRPPHLSTTSHQQPSIVSEGDEDFIVSGSANAELRRWDLSRVRRRSSNIAVEKSVVLSVIFSHTFSPAAVDCEWRRWGAYRRRTTCGTESRRRQVDCFRRYFEHWRQQSVGRAQSAPETDVCWCDIHAARSTD